MSCRGQPDEARNEGGGPWDPPPKDGVSLGSGFEIAADGD